MGEILQNQMQEVFFKSFPFFFYIENVANQESLERVIRFIMVQGFKLGVGYGWQPASNLTGLLWSYLDDTVTILLLC